MAARSKHAYEFMDVAMWKTTLPKSPIVDKIIKYQLIFSAFVSAFLLFFL
jgi:hypothetical protein